MTVTARPQRRRPPVRHRWAMVSVALLLVAAVSYAVLVSISAADAAETALFVVTLVSIFLALAAAWSAVIGSQGGRPTLLPTTRLGLLVAVVGPVAALAGYLGPTSGNNAGYYMLDMVVLVSTMVAAFVALGLRERSVLVFLAGVGPGMLVVTFVLGELAFPH